MDTLFDKDFYPTPREVAEKMLINVDIKGKTVLEPSAGNGNLVDLLNEEGAAAVLACETNADLRRLLATKCEVVTDDFLKMTANDAAAVQLIVANPPFSDQVKHIRHMFEIAPEGCEIVTLCNDSLFKKYNVTQDEQSILETIENWGWHESLGEVFAMSDRPTNVNVGLIHLFKPRTGDNMFEDYFTDTGDEQEPQACGLIKYSEIRDYVNRYVEAVKRFDSVMDANKSINDLISVFGDTGISFGAFATTDRYGEKQPISRNAFRIRLQKQAWRQVFGKLQMGRFLTTDTMRELDAAISHQENFPFTVRNVHKMIDLLLATHGERMKKCIIDTFDKICSYSPENSTAGEKWKTNSNYMVNRRFIIPNICEYNDRWDRGRETIRMSWESSLMLDDITKALCMATGTRYDETGESLIYIAEKMRWGKKFNYSFFICKGFKKGTMHFEFRDEATWATFNRTVAKIRGWQLPANTAKTKGNEF